MQPSGAHNTDIHLQMDCVRTKAGSDFRPSASGLRTPGGGSSAAGLSSGVEGCGEELDFCGDKTRSREFSWRIFEIR